MPPSPSTTQATMHSARKRTRKTAPSHSPPASVRTRLLLTWGATGLRLTAKGARAATARAATSATAGQAKGLHAYGQQRRVGANRIATGTIEVHPGVCLRPARQKAKSIAHAQM